MADRGAVGSESQTDQRLTVTVSFTGISHHSRFSFAFSILESLQTARVGVLSAHLLGFAFVEGPFAGPMLVRHTSGIFWSASGASRTASQDSGPQQTVSL